MRLTPLDQLHPGDRIGRDVRVGATPIPLVRAGVSVTPGYVEGMRRAGVRAVWVDDALSAGIDPVEPVSEETRRQATKSLQRAFGTMTRVDGGAASAIPQQAVRELHDLATRIAADVADCGDAVVAISDLATHDSYTLQHSIDVTAIGLLLAQRLWSLDGWIGARGERRYDGIDGRLVKLGVGLLLHDIGKLVLPHDLLQKPGPLTDEEFELVRQHPEAGYEMLAETPQLSPLARDVVRHHHERWDGSGYPDGKVGAETPQFSRIAAVADVFDAVGAERPYKAAAPVHVAVSVIVEGEGELFDPEVVRVFRTTVAAYPAGTAVELSDGRRGLVVDCPPWAADRPRVRIVAEGGAPLAQPVEVALAEERGLEVVGVDVPLPRAPQVAAAV